jgi:hypothetical protein
MEPNLAVFHTVEFFGFYLPPAMLWAAVALVPFVIVRWLMGKLDLYHYVWHRSLFNLALYVLMVGGVIFLGGRAWL